jgi:hypothetical protein
MRDGAPGLLRKTVVGLPTRKRDERWPRAERVSARGRFLFRARWAGSRSLVRLPALRRGRSRRCVSPVCPLSSGLRNSSVPSGPLFRAFFRYRGGTFEGSGTTTRHSGSNASHESLTRSWASSPSSVQPAEVRDPLCCGEPQGSQPGVRPPANVRQRERRDEPLQGLGPGEALFFSHRPERRSPRKPRWHWDFGILRLVSSTFLHIRCLRGTHQATIRTRLP